MTPNDVKPMPDERDLDKAIKFAKSEIYDAESQSWLVDVIKAAQECQNWEMKYLRMTEDCYKMRDEISRLKEQASDCQEEQHLKVIADLMDGYSKLETEISRLKKQQPERHGSALIVDAGRSEPISVYPYKDGSAVSLNAAVRRAMFSGDISPEQENEAAQLTGDLIHDGEFHGEDFTLTLRSLIITDEGE